MKKFVCIMLALMCFASVAVAATPSKTTGNMTASDSKLTNTQEEAGLVILIDYDGNNEEHAQMYSDELVKLQAATPAAAYFGDVKDMQGNSVSLEELLGTDDVKVNEFAPLIVENYKESYGNVTTTFTLPTFYNQGEKVVILIGIRNAQTGEIEWIALEGVGVGEDGAIQVEFPPELLIAIQNSNALMAVASK